MPTPLLLDQSGMPVVDAMIGQNRPSQNTTAAAKREPYGSTDIVWDQLDVWLRDREAHRIWAERAVKCVEYIRGKQWDDATIRKLAAQGRPALTFNNIRPLARLLLGYYLQNKADIRYLPTSSGGATQDIADAITHTMKQADEDTAYRWTEAAIFRDGLSAGRGWLDMRMSYDKNIYGNIDQLDLDPFQVYVDCDASSFNIADHNHVTVNRYMSLEEVLLQFGGEAAIGLRNRVAGTMSILPDSDLGDGDGDEITPDRFFGLRDYLRNTSPMFSRVGGVRGTFPSEHVDRQRKVLRVLDRQHRKLRQCRYFVDIQTGDKIEVPHYWPEDRIRWVIQSCMAKGYEMTVISGLAQAWRWTVTCLDTVLWDDWSPFQEPTIIGYFPYFERGLTPSFAEDLIDPQNEINKRRSALIHSVMSSANPGWIYEAGTLDKDMEVALAEEGSAPGVILKWRRLRDNSQPPRRIEPGMPPQGMRLLEREAQEDIRVISGINESAMGHVDKVQSGRAIEARQRQAVVTHEQVFDNMSQFRELRGRKGLGYIQGFYTQQRLIRTVGDNGKDQQTMINTRMATGEVVNDVAVGRYRVAVDEAPASATFYAAQFDEAMEMVEKGLIPPTMADIIIDLSTMPRKEEIKARLERDRQMAQAAQMGGGMPMPAAGGPPGAPPPGAAPGGMVPPPGMPMPGMAGPGGMPMTRPPPMMPAELYAPPPQPGQPQGFQPPPAAPGAPQQVQMGGAPMLPAPLPPGAVPPPTMPPRFGGF